MEDLEEACEASLQRGILRADLFKVFPGRLIFESFVGEVDALLTVQLCFLSSPRANRTKFRSYMVLPCSTTVQMVLVVHVTSFDDTISSLPSDMQLEGTAWTEYIYMPKQSNTWTKLDGFFPHPPRLQIEQCVEAPLSLCLGLRGKTWKCEHFHGWVLSDPGGRCGMSDSKRSPGASHPMLGFLASARPPCGLASCNLRRVFFGTLLKKWPRWEDDYVNLFHGGCHLPNGVYLSSSHSVPFLNQKMCLLLGVYLSLLRCVQPWGYPVEICQNPLHVLQDSILGSQALGLLNPFFLDTQ